MIFTRSVTICFSNYLTIKEYKPVVRNVNLNDNVTGNYLTIKEYKHSEVLHKQAFLKSATI